MTAPDPFYIVWCPDGVRPPRKRHEAFGRADAEARRLARENPGQEFFVMAAVRSVCVGRMNVSDYASLDDTIPF